MVRSNGILWVVGAAALVVTAVLLRESDPPAGPIDQPPHSEGAALDAAGVRATDSTEETESEVEVMPAPPSRPRRATRTLSVSVRFPDGEAASATVLAVTRNPDSLISANTRNGRCELDLVGEHATVWCRVGGYDDLVNDLPLGDEPLEPMVFELPVRRRIAIRAVGPGGTSVRFHPEFLTLGLAVPPSLHAIATRGPPPAILSPSTATAREAYGAGRFVDYLSPGAITVPSSGLGVLLVDDDERLWVSLVYGTEVIETREWAGENEVVFELAPDDLRRRTARLQARLSGPPGGGSRISGRGRLDLGSVHGDWRDTAPTGALSLAGAGGGIYWLVVEASGHATLRRPVHLAGGQTITLEPIELRPAVSLAGLARNAGPQAVSGKIYCIDPALPTVPVLIERAGFEVSSDGSFHLRNIPAGRVHLVLVTRSMLRVARTIDTPVDGNEELLLDLPATRLVVLEGSGLAAPRGVYTVVDSAGRPLWSGRVRARDRVPLYVLPGRYEIHWREHELSPDLLAVPVPFDVEDKTAWVPLPGR